MSSGIVVYEEGITLQTTSCTVSSPIEHTALRRTRSDGQLPLVAASPAGDDSSLASVSGRSLSPGSPREQKHHHHQHRHHHHHRRQDSDNSSHGSSEYRHSHSSHHRSSPTSDDNHHHRHTHKHGQTKTHSRSRSPPSRKRSRGKGGSRMFAHSLNPQVLPRMSPGLSEQSWATSRLLAEKLSLWTLGKGFVVRSWLRPWQSPAVKVVKRGVLLGPTEALLAQLPDVYGLYMLLAKPPGARRYLPVFLGKAGPAEGEGGGETIRERFRTAHLANDDGTFGPADEARKYLTLLDLQRRAFSLQVRYRTVRGPSAKDDESAMLRRFNFAYNYQENVSYRPLKLRCGKRVVDYPIVLSNVDEVYKGVEEEHPGMHSIEEQFKTLRISEG